MGAHLGLDGPGQGFPSGRLGALCPGPPASLLLEWGRGNKEPITDSFAGTDRWVASTTGGGGRWLEGTRGLQVKGSIPITFGRQQANPRSVPTSKSRAAEGLWKHTLGFKPWPPLSMTLGKPLHLSASQMTQYLDS